MRVLATGLYLWGDQAQLALYASQCGHEVRTLAMEGEADYHFEAKESAVDVVARIGAEWMPDLLLCGTPEMTPPPLAIEACPIRTVAFVSDWNLHHPQLECNLARFDMVLMDKSGIQDLRLQGDPNLYFQPIYSHRSLIHRPLGLERDIDILFLGNLNHAIHRERGACVEVMAALSDDCHAVIDSEVPPEEYARLMNRARIVLNYAVRHEMNLRAYEAPACGALLFLEDENLEVGDFLAEGREVVLYNCDNLVEKLTYYLAHEEEGRRIAEAGQRKIEGLAAEKRLDALFNWIEGQAMGARRFKLLPELQRAEAEVLFYSNSGLIAENPALAAAKSLMALDENRLAAHLAAAMLAYSMGKRSAPAERDVIGQKALAHFKRAAELAPENGVCWMNLALVLEKTDNRDAERQCLAMVMACTAVDGGGFLLGKTMDPYFAQWRLALALGKTKPGMLHAQAAARLAQIAMQEERFEDAWNLARRSISLAPEIGIPYRIAGQAARLLGRKEEALAMFREGLAHTSLDGPYRMDLVSLLRELGHRSEARALALQSRRIFQACVAHQERAREFADMLERIDSEQASM